MKTILATAAVLLGALLLPVAAYSADKPASASPSSANETASASDAKDRPVRQGRRSSQPIDDSVITTKVKALLAKDKLMSALNIEVKTIDGVVELGGEAKSRQEAAKAVSIARKVKGVKSVKNMISVAGAPAGTMADKDRPARRSGDTMADKDRPAKMGRSDQPVDDTLITTKVKAAYAKDKQVSALNTEVNTVNGVVTLTGTAKSKAEADQAAALARRVQGVKSVQNDIKVQ
jgi:osmotically-inducible protein OsmY